MIQAKLTLYGLSFQIHQKLVKKFEKVAGHVAANNISRTAVPIGRRSSTIPLNNNKTINVKRSHLPLVCACATTIHKSQGNTYSEIVYEYDKKQSQSLVYVALSRVTTIEGLRITTSNNDLTFYHGRRPSTTMIHLRDEFRRLSLNCVKTVDSDMLYFIRQEQGLTVYTLNCQSLRSHSQDLLKKSNYTRI
ncbi:uncharacterized protein TNCV_4674591 [Trichonephila clavipes]|nr:uncharacterized protein TNCV_4674591 [Trichonephila clavipes]